MSAPTPLSQVDQERRAAIIHALSLIRGGRRGRATYELARSVTRQTLMDGGGSWPLPICARCVPRCPCKGGGGS